VYLGNEAHSSPLPNIADIVLQVFFVEDKAMPGWSVVMKKETRSRRILSTQEDNALGQEASTDDMQVMTNFEPQRVGWRENVAVDEVSTQQANGRRRSRNEAR
jgi:hypothetical protein